MPNTHLSFYALDMKKYGILCLLIVSLDVILTEAEKGCQAYVQASVRFLELKSFGAVILRIFLETMKLENYRRIVGKYTFLAVDVIVGRWNFDLVQKFLEYFHYFLLNLINRRICFDGFVKEKIVYFLRKRKMRKVYAG